MARPKGSSPRKDWYSVSVETLRGLGLLLLILAVLGASWFGYRVWERVALEREVAQILDETTGLIQRLQGNERMEEFRNEYDTAWKSLRQARSDYAAGRFRSALAAGRSSREVLLSIVGALALPGSAGQAQFISVHGDVVYRRGGAGDWQEARSRQPLYSGDYVRTSENGSAEIVFMDGTLYTMRPNTQLIVAPGRTGPGQTPDQSIQMEYGWVDLSTADRGSKVRTPRAVAQVRKDSEAFVAFDNRSNRGRFGAFRGGIDLRAGGVEREIQELQQVLQEGDVVSQPTPLPGRPEPVEPADNFGVDLERQRTLVLAWRPVAGAARYALQISRNSLFVDNLIDVGNRAKTRATLGLRGEGTFQWRVAAVSPEGARGPWSTPRKFRVASVRGVAGAAAAELGAGDTGGERDRTPPNLDLEDVKTYGSIFIVGGRSEPGSLIEVNDEQVKVEADGSFTKTVQLTQEGWSFIEIKAYDPSGNEAVRRVRVFVEGT